MSGRFGGWRHRSLIMVAVAVVVMAAVLLGRDKASNSGVCERRAGAEICLVANGPAYRIEGKGFAPGDDVQIKFTGEDPFFLWADVAGRVPGPTGGVAGFLPGDSATRVTVLGNGASGEAVYIELPVCGRTASGRAAC